MISILIRKEKIIFLHILQQVCFVNELIWFNYLFPGANFDTWIGVDFVFSIVFSLGSINLGRFLWKQRLSDYIICASGG